MAYIGAKPVNGFFEKQDLTTDGSTTTFTLNTAVGSSSSIIVSVGGVIQEPEVAYNLGGGGTTIVFTEAFCVHGRHIYSLSRTSCHSKSYRC